MSLVHFPIAVRHNYLSRSCRHILYKQLASNLQGFCDILELIHNHWCPLQYLLDVTGFLLGLAEGSTFAVSEFSLLIATTSPAGLTVAMVQQRGFPRAVPCQESLLAMVSGAHLQHGSPEGCHGDLHVSILVNFLKKVPESQVVLIQIFLREAERKHRHNRELKQPPMAATGSPLIPPAVTLPLLSPSLIYVSP